MAELQQIIGAILRDISKARFSSDIYARDVARCYEQDPLLRRFPSPRSEIEEVELDLKFSISGVAFEPSQSEGREATAAVIFSHFANTIAEMVISRSVATIASSSQPTAGGWAEQAKRWIDSIPFKIDVQQDVLHFLMDGFSSLINPEGHLDLEAAANGIDAVVGKTFKQEMDRLEAYLSERGKAELEGKPQDMGALTETIMSSVAKDVSTQCATLKADIEEMWIRRGDCRVDVEVSADKLSHMQESAISTVRIKTVVRNYVWTQIEKKPDGRIWRSLNPE